MNLIKKHLLTIGVAIGCALSLLSTASAQTALFAYNDGNGVPNAGTYHPGDSFTFSITLFFAPGGTIQNLEGLSYWFQQKSPSGAPFPFSITLRDVTGSQFTDLKTAGLTYPQNLNPSNPNDLGASLPPAQPALGAGSYFIADITVSISPTAPITGTYVLSDTLSGSMTSEIFDSLGDTFAIPEADYIVTMVPEPATWAAGCLILAGLAGTWRCRATRRS